MESGFDQQSKCTYFILPQEFSKLNRSEKRCWMVVKKSIFVLFQRLKQSLWKEAEDAAKPGTRGNGKIQRDCSTANNKRGQSTELVEGERVRVSSAVSTCKEVFVRPWESVPSERVFSTAGDIITAQRSTLTPEHLDQILFLNKNLKTNQVKYKF